MATSLFVIWASLDIRSFVIRVALASEEELVARLAQRIPRNVCKNSLRTKDCAKGVVPPTFADSCLRRSRERRIEPSRRQTFDKIGCWSARTQFDFACDFASSGSGFNAAASSENVYSALRWRGKDLQDVLRIDTALGPPTISAPSGSRRTIAKPAGAKPSPPNNQLFRRESASLDSQLVKAELQVRQALSSLTAWHVSFLA